jgi:Mrp family chromosome partitioning ATPase
MSAIDNAFIRAYTLDTTATSVPAKSQFDDRSPFESSSARTSGAIAVAQPVPQPATAKPLPPVERSPRRPVGPPARAAAQSAVAPRRTTIVHAAKAPPLAAVPAALSAVVPAPHIRLAPFIHTTTTLDLSSPVQVATMRERLSPNEPAAASSSAEVESLAAPLAADPDVVEPPITESPIAALNDAPVVSPTINPPAPAAAATPILPSTLPLSAEAAANSAIEADGPRAAFDVDQFAWPELCDALLAKRTGEFDQLVGQLVTESALGRKVIAITGSRRGDGRTTLALLLARRLAATAVKVVVVDADFEYPQLAARLGMTIGSGWENILVDKLPVWDGLVESLADGMSLLPLAPRPATSAGQPTAAEFVGQHEQTIRQHLAELRRHFDVVLVDAGAIKAVRPDAKPRGPLALAGSLDAAIIVSDARMASAGRIAELQRRLQEARIVSLGIAENFCPSKP